MRCQLVFNVGSGFKQCENFTNDNHDVHRNGASWVVATAVSSVPHYYLLPDGKTVGPEDM